MHFSNINIIFQFAAAVAFILVLDICECFDTNKRHHKHHEDVVAIELEGGVCGRGEQYTYFVRPGSSQYVAFIFIGSGFCFDDASCGAVSTDIESEFIETALSEYPQYSNDYYTDNNIFGYAPFDSTLLTWTLVMLPQCTEDFNAGVTTVEFENTGTFYFQGGNNINLIVNEILEGSGSGSGSGGTIVSESKSKGPKGGHGSNSKSIADFVNFDDMKHFVLVGQSSGAYASALWGNVLFDYVSDNTLKTMILDSFWLQKSLEELVVPGLISLYDGLNSPALSKEVIEYITNGGLPLLPDLVQLDLDKYCDLFVSFVWYEFDSTMASYHYLFDQDLRYFDENYWKQIFSSDVADRYAFDSKRTSFYVAQGEGHVATLDSNWNDLSTKCDEAPTMDEYIKEVVGDRNLVHKYSCDSVKRIAQYPKYSWNNIDIECIECE